MRWVWSTRRSTPRRRDQGRPCAQGSPVGALLVGASLCLAVGGCYRGDFLELACDRQGTCVGTDSASTGTLTTSPTTSSGGETDASTTGTTATETGSGTGMVSKLDAYRLTSVTIVDPHVYYDLGGCGDRTALMNYAISEEIEEGGAVNMVLLFDPADPEAKEATMVLVEGDCTFGPEGARCWQSEDGTYVKTTATNSPDLACDVTLPPTINPLYAAEGAPNIAPPPCFASPRGTVILPSLAEGLPPMILYDAQLSGSYGLGGIGPGIDELETGLITGFIPESSAREIDGLIADLPFNLWGTIAGGDGCQPDVNNPIDDTDPDPNPENPERGIQMYLNFEAERVQWLE